MAMARVIDGKTLADELCRRVAAATAGVAAAAGAPPGLVAILVGDDPASHSYVGRKDRAAAAAGFAAQTLALPATTSQAALLAEIERLNRDGGVDGILVQLPLPAHIDARRIIDAVDPAKDVDGFHPLNIGRLWSGLPGLVPATPQGCMLLLKSTHADLAGLEAVVLGRSNIVGKPMAALLLAADCTVGWAHSRSRDAASICRRADILVVAAGRPGLVGRHWIKPGATVIDVGINRVPAADGKSRLVGDVDYPAASGVAGAITPVPGGVGPMTIACLLRNTLLAACRRRALAEPAV